MNSYVEHASLLGQRGGEHKPSATVQRLPTRLGGALHLYQKTIRAYAAKGARIGFTSFSVRNTAVLNIYSQLGARFTSAEGVWLWHPGKDQVYSRN